MSREEKIANLLKTIKKSKLNEIYENYKNCASNAKDPKFVYVTMTSNVKYENFLLEIGIHDKDEQIKIIENIEKEIKEYTNKVNLCIKEKMVNYLAV